MQMNSRVTVCLARVKKRHKCKFVPRLLFMMVGCANFAYVLEERYSKLFQQ